MGYSGRSAKDAAAAVDGRRLTKEQLREVFIKFDKNKDKLLSRSELKKAFIYLGSQYPAYRAAQSVLFTDENDDGYIDYNELNVLVKYASRLGYTVK